MIAEEIGSHIEDQSEAYEQQGLSHEEALSLAVKDMGDPVDTGVSLDRIHRPQMAWGMLFLIGIISLVSFLVQLLIAKQNTAAPVTFAIYRQLIILGIGVAFMILTYFIDYSRIGRYARIAGAVFCIFIFVNGMFTGMEINGAKRYFSVLGIPISITMLLYLYVPMYGAMLYQYRGKGYRAVGKGILWLILPVLLELRIPSLSQALNIFIILAVLLTIAVIKGWYIVNKKLVLCLGWGLALSAPIAILIIAFSRNQTVLAAYQAARIRTLVDPSSSEAGYMVTTVRQFIRSSKLIGMSDATIKTQDYLPSVNVDFVLTHVISYYGILAASAIVLLLIVLIRKIFKISLSQKNQLGMIMGFGCGLAYSIQAITYILQNIGFWPTTEVFLPLFSYGGTGTIVSYILLGILLSIYRYQNILPENVPKGKSIRVLLVENH